MARKFWNCWRSTWVLRTLKLILLRAFNSQQLPYSPFPSLPYIWKICKRVAVVNVLRVIPKETPKVIQRIPKRMWNLGAFNALIVLALVTLQQECPNFRTLRAKPLICVLVTIESLTTLRDKKVEKKVSFMAFLACVNGVGFSRVEPHVVSESCTGWGSLVLEYMSSLLAPLLVVCSDGMSYDSFSRHSRHCGMSTSSFKGERWYFEAFRWPVITPFEVYIFLKKL
jgi:hypothetical protein